MLTTDTTMSFVKAFEVYHLTYTVMALGKRFAEYQTMGELFSDMEDDLMALTLWKRVLACIERILCILGETLGITPQHLMATISDNDKEMSKILVMVEALENGMKYMDRLHNFC